jgi:hypothetical protein
MALMMNPMCLRIDRCQSMFTTPRTPNTLEHRSIIKLEIVHPPTLISIIMNRLHTSQWNESRRLSERKLNIICPSTKNHQTPNDLNEPRGPYRLRCIDYLYTISKYSPRLICSKRERIKKMSSHSSTIFERD